MSSKTYLTQEGYQKLSQQLADLKTKQQHLVAQIEEVAQPDESGEDGLAQQLKEELEVVLTKIDQLESAISNAKIINQKTSNDSVEIGSRVKIKLNNNTVKEFKIVDKLEADPTQNKISHQSPLGQALLGKKVNEKIEVQAPVGTLIYKIISIM